MVDAISSAAAYPDSLLRPSEVALLFVGVVLFRARKQHKKKTWSQSNGRENDNGVMALNDVICDVGRGITIYYQ